jgi:large subunit ribosomal protein L18
MLKKVIARVQRHNRVRAKISGTATRPRLCVFRSNSNIYAQLIDDVAAKTLCAASDLKTKKGSKVEKATIV